MSPFRLCRAGSAWGLVCRVLGVSMGAASTTTCGHEIPLDQKRGHRSFARIVKQVRICWRQTWLADHTVSKYFCFPSKDLEVNWGNNRLQTINSSNLVLPSCGVHWTSGLLAVSLVIFLRELDLFAFSFCLFHSLPLFIVWSVCLDITWSYASPSKTSQCSVGWPLLLFKYWCENPNCRNLMPVITELPIQT